MVSQEALDFQGRYDRSHGVDAPALNAVAEFTCAALHVVVELATRAGALTVPALAGVLDDAVLELARGRLRLQGGRAVQDVHLPQAHACDFEIVDRLSERPTAPGRRKALLLLSAPLCPNGNDLGVLPSWEGAQSRLRGRWDRCGTEKHQRIRIRCLLIDHGLRPAHST